jgi:SAM-dependent methyltransferase
MDLRFTFNEDAENYDRFRPTYPDELFADILKYSGLDEKGAALEIGIGTGQATEPILRTGCTVTAIELGDRLSRFVQEKFRKYRNFHVIHADFMTVPPKPDSYDLAYCATAFHWLPMEEGYRKIKYSLKAGGTIALFWNHPFPNRTDDPSNLVNRRVYGRYRPSDQKAAEFCEKDCERRTRELERFGFQDVEAKLYHRVRTLSSDSYIALLNTYSDHRALDVKIKDAFEAEMKASIDEIGGKINLYDTIDLYLARKP